jgi:uncharacterized protein (DUF1800 family)
MADISFDEAAHLLRRMGFGGPPEEIDDIVSRGREGAVDHLISYDQIDNKAMEDVLERSFDFSDPLNNQNFNQNEIRRWWFTRMILTRRQFEEKMTLFWHNHFATALSKVQDMLMFVQIDRTLRPFALDRFDTLLLKVSQDPAMLVWLDGITSVRGRPNENFARELQELFTLGINDLLTGQPNYSEDDVKEIARAFTGWQFRRPNRQDPLNLQFFINPNLHDNGPKTIYGQTANFSGEDVITIISAKRSTARFLVHELFDFFVYPLSSSSQDNATIEKFADVYVSSDHSMRELVRAIFTSDEFFSDRARFGLVKNPVEFIVGSYRALGAQYDPGSSDTRRNQRDNLTHVRSRLMGMDVFNPPDVNGWDLNLGWVNTSSMLERFNFSNTYITRRVGSAAGAFVSIEQLKKYTKPNAKKTVKKFLSVLGPLKVSKATLKQLKTYLVTDDQGNTVQWSVNDQTIDKKVRGLVHQIMSLPEYQLN